MSFKSGEVGSLWVGRMSGMVLSVALLWAGSAPAGEAMRGATVIDGQVAANEAGVLTVGVNGAELSLAPDVRVVAAPGTKLKMGRSLKLSLGTGANAAVPSRVVTLYEGDLDVFVPKTKPMTFAVLVVESGKGRIRTISRGGHTSVHAKENEFRLSALAHSALYSIGTGWKRVKEGQARTFRPAQPMGRVQSLPVPVRQLTSSRYLLADSSSTVAQAQLSWQPGSEGARYEVVLSAPNGALESRVITAEPLHLLSGLASGKYFARVRGVNRHGVGGEWSKTIELNVVGFEIEKSPAMSEVGVIRLLPGQRVGLVGAEGLEISYVGVDTFIPAPTSLGLIARRPILVDLRQPSSGELMRVNIVPMTVRARIEIERAPNRWPRFGLPVVVHLLDNGGLRVPDSFQVSVRASINLTPSVTEWRREPGLLRGRLPRPVGEGPWVVRLEIYDAGGVLLGREVQDIGYQEASKLAATK